MISTGLPFGKVLIMYRMHYCTKSIYNFFRKKKKTFGLSQFQKYTNLLLTKAWVNNLVWFTVWVGCQYSPQILSTECNQLTKFLDQFSFIHIQRNVRTALSNRWTCRFNPFEFCFCFCFVLVFVLFLNSYHPIAEQNITTRLKKKKYWKSAHPSYQKAIASMYICISNLQPWKKIVGTPNAIYYNYPYAYHCNRKWGITLINQKQRFSLLS